MKKGSGPLTDGLFHPGDTQTRPKSNEQKNSKCPSPTMSLKSDKSRDYPVNFQSNKQKNSKCPSPTMSLKSDKSRDYPVNFQSNEQESSSCPSPTMSLKSDKSRDYPVNFQSNKCPSPTMSLKSDKSRDYPVNFQRSDQEASEEAPGFHTDLQSVFKALERETLPFLKNKLKQQLLSNTNSPKQLWSHDEKKDVLRCEEGENFSSEEEQLLNFLQEFLRMKKHKDVPSALLSSHSAMRPPKDQENSKMCVDDDQQLVAERLKLRRSASVTPNHETPKDAKSENHSFEAKRSPRKANMDSMEIEILEGNIVSFVENELRHFCKLLEPENHHSQDGDATEVNWDEEEQMSIIKEAFLNITLRFLRRMKQDALASALHDKSIVAKCQRKHKSNLKTKVEYVFEGIGKESHATLLNQIYTELYIVEGDLTGVNFDNEVTMIEKAVKKPVKPIITIRREDIFKPFTGSDEPIRTVMTEGVAGIGKTVLTQKFVLDWAENKNNQEFQFMFPFTFRGLNMLNEKKYSLVELIHLFFPEIKEAGICSFEEFRVLFILDGLDECRFPLTLKTEEILIDVTEPTSLDVMLTNLFKGNLLPSACIWITSRPAAAYFTPPELYDLVTDVRGFNDLQKEEYFRKRFPEEEESKLVISHIKTSSSLFIMCHIPVFCWITATVLEDALKIEEKTNLPTSLTEMNILFLMVLAKVKNVKYDRGAARDSPWTPESRTMIQALGKLAFEQLIKGNMFFHESDLTECGIDVRTTSVHSGVFTQILQEERGLLNQNMFCFVHRSVQEFLAALHGHLTFTNTGVNLLEEEDKSKTTEEQFEHFYLTAVRRSLENLKGDLNLFVRFLLGLSLETNQRLLQGFAPVTEIPSSSIQNVTQYIKKQIGEAVCLFQINNLFYCLNELKDYSLGNEIEQTLKLGKLKTEKLSSAMWAALVNIFLSSEEYQENFNLRKYFVTEQAQRGLFLFLINTPKVVLSCCCLNETSYRIVADALKIKCDILKEMDLSNNDMKASELKLLCEGLSNPNCCLEVLRLSGCLITKEGCVELKSALASNPSQLRELDLSYNHPGESGVTLLSAGLEDPTWALQTLRLEPRGIKFLKPGLRKYAVDLTLDPDTAHKNLTLSDGDRKVTAGNLGKCSDHPWRFKAVEQLLCKDGLTGRCYWEVEWRGSVSVGVTCKGIKRRGERKDCTLGMNDQSWSLLCSEDGLSVMHDNKRIKLFEEPSARVGVYLDWPGGTLSFFRVSSGKVTFLHSYNTEFTGPVYPAFRVEPEPFNSSLSLCSI